MFGNKLQKVESAVQKKKEAPLVKLTEDKDMQVRLAAIAGLGKVGQDDGCNTLITLLHDPNDDIRSAAATALGEMGNGHAKAHISYQIQQEKNPAVKETMSHALHLIKDYN